MGENLTRRGQPRLQHQDLPRWSDPAGISTLHYALQVLANSQLQQAVLGKLLGGHAIPRFLVHAPGPNQHFVGNGFLIEMPIRLPFDKIVPD